MGLLSMKKTTMLAVALATFLFSGCSTMMSSVTTAGGSEEKIKSMTAIELDMDENNIAISNKKVIDEYTYYTVTTKKGTHYNCRTEGGGLAYGGSFMPPQCAKKGEKIPEPLNPLTASQKQSTKKATK